MTKTAAAIAVALLMLPSAAHAWDDFFYTWKQPYQQRVEGVTIGAGDAKSVNSATHIIDPWPPYVHNRRIPANGARMVGAIQRYKDVTKLDEGAKTLAPELTAEGGAGKTQ